jgi:hypothetical protein
MRRQHKEYTRAGNIQLLMAMGTWDGQAILDC